MANPPENDMDQLLKRYAKQRRDEAPTALEMPPATRQALRAEVARVFPRESALPVWLRFFSGFWPRLAIGCGLIVVLALAALVSLRTERKLTQEFELAKSTDADGVSISSGSPSSAPVTASELTLSLPAPKQLSIGAGSGSAIVPPDGASERTVLAQLAVRDSAEIESAEAAAAKTSLAADISTGEAA